MKTTGNLGLKKPEGTDIVDINDLNGNMDILDTAVKAAQDHAADTTRHITAAERTAWNAKAPLASPAFTGVPTAPTAAAGTNTTQIATTAFVAAMNDKSVSRVVAPFNSLAAGSEWKRIAVGAAGLAKKTATFELAWIGTGLGGNATIEVSIYDVAKPMISQTLCSSYGAMGITQVRIVYGPSGSEVYLEVLKSASVAFTSFEVVMIGSKNWSLLANTQSGAIPGGYTSADVNIVSGAIISNSDVQFVNGNFSGMQASNVEFGDVNVTGSLTIEGMLNVTGVPGATTSDMNFFISATTGSDTNTGLDQGNKLKTLARLFEDTAAGPKLMPDIINHTVNVIIDDGTYAEALKIKGFSGAGKITINSGSTYRTALLIRGAEITQCTCRVEINGVTTDPSGNYWFNVDACSDLSIRFVTIQPSTLKASTAIDIDSSNVAIGSCNISNMGGGIRANYNSRVFVSSTSGTGVILGYTSTNNSRMTLTSTGISATTLLSVGSGGEIFNQQTTGIINSWGDNTTSSRVIGEMARIGAGAQGISANTITKVLWTYVFTNNKNVCNVSNSKFVIPENGMYSVCFRVGLDCSAPSTTQRVMTFITVNGVINAQITDVPVLAGVSGVTSSGSSLMYCNSGDTIELYIQSSVGGTISNGDTYTHASIVRIA
jgi:hypothetical protein